MKKTARYNGAVTNTLPILICCGLIVFTATSCRKNENDPGKPTTTVQTSEKTNSAWASFFPDGLMDSDGVDIPFEHFEGKNVGLYFSASWCVPCHRFSPLLIDFQNQHQEHFEVILVGRDGAEEKQLEYMKEHNMAFPTTKWANGRNAQSDNLRDKYQVTSIPRLVILSSKGQLVMDSAREAIESTPEEIAELFTNKAKLAELVAANAKILAMQAKEAQAELQNKKEKYAKALEETFPPLGQSHRTTRIAHYKFDSTAADSLNKSPDFTLKNTTYQDGALSLNGKFFTKDNGYRSSLSLADLNYTQFSIGQEFLIREPANVTKKSTTILVGGGGYRWFGLKRYPDGNVELFFNGGGFARILSDAEVTFNQWNRILTSVDLHQGVVRVWCNGKLLPEIKLPKDFLLDVIISRAVQADRSFHHTNHSNGETLDGLVDEVVVFDGPLSEAEMAKEAASFGSRWAK